MYDLFEAEAKSCLAHRLVTPAHDYVLRCSHTFNLLDARGAIGVTERPRFLPACVISRGRSRWLTSSSGNMRSIRGWRRAKERGKQGSGRRPSVPVSVDAASTFLLEIGAEELPAADLQSAIEQLKGVVPKLLADLRLTHGAIFVSGTPRRLVAQIEALAPRQADEETVVKGPPAERAFDASGAATQAAVGFARKNGVPVGALETRQEGAGRYVYAVVRRAGQPTLDVLPEALSGLVAGIKFGKTMRWNA